MLGSVSFILGKGVNTNLTVKDIYIGDSSIGFESDIGDMTLNTDFVDFPCHSAASDSLKKSVQL